MRIRAVEDQQLAAKAPTERLGESWDKDETFDPNDWVAKPVREIIRETKEQANAKESGKDNPKPATAGQANGITGGVKTPQPQNQQPATTQAPNSNGTPQQDPMHSGEPKFGGKTP